MSSGPKKKLILFECRMIGDAVLSLPFVRSASREYEVIVVCTQGASRVFLRVLPPASVWIWDPPWLEGRGLSHARDLIRRLQSLKACIAVCVWPDARIQAIMGAVGTPKRIGYPMSEVNLLGSHLGWRKRQILLGRGVAAAASLLCLRAPLTQRLYREAKDEPILDAWRRLGDACGVTLDLRAPWFEAESEGRAEMVMKEDDRVVLLLHPGARNPCRRWPAENFIALIRLLAGSDRVRVVVIEPPDSPALDLTGLSVTSIRPPGLEVLEAQIDQVDIVVCNDTSVAHIGAALGKRVVTIFGPMTPRIFAPYGSEALTVSVNVCPHRPCLDRCLMPSPICMEQIGVEEVLEQIRQACPRLGDLA